ncbi:MAG: hypothetical protein KDC93_02460 [Cyclobacteriaceae bacterium]|jgi:SH3-like domain-containing protein|nr:hypothetical protein [Cyclobacteriaceae bacterium]
MSYRFQRAFYGLLLCAIAPAAAQQDQGGFLAPGDSLKKILPFERIIFLPEDGFTFYEVPNGEFKGKILPGPPLSSSGSTGDIDTLLSSTITGASIRPQLLSIDNYFETSDDRYHLTFDRQQDGYVRVFFDGYRGWISTEEIKSKGFVLTSWMAFYGEAKGNMIHPTEKIAAVRMSPYMDAPIIETADELYSEITTIGICEGSFCKVKVVQYKNPYDPTKSKEENILKKYKGWLQIIDEEGQPLVAHNSHGA